MIRNNNVSAVLASVALMFIGAHTAQAGFAEGMLAYSRGDMKVAIREFTPVAEANDSRAQFLLAQIYEQTRSAPKGQAQAVMWYRRAAINGVVAAMRRLGDIYGNSQGSGSDPVQAYAWYDFASSRLSPHRDRFGRLRDDLAAKMHPLTLDHARHVALYWRANTTKIGIVIPAPAPPSELTSTVEAVQSKKLSTKQSGAAVQAAVRRVQTALAVRGYDVGIIDGIFGSRTRAAIRAFQSDQGLEPDGQVTADLIERAEGDAEDG